MLPLIYVHNQRTLEIFGDLGLPDFLFFFKQTSNFLNEYVAIAKFEQEAHPNGS